MESVIYTYGGGKILWQILNAVALLTKDGELGSLIKFILVIGALWIGAQSLSQGSPMMFLKKFMVPALAITGLLYTQKTKVMIIDEVDPDHKVSKVDGVPLAIGFLGSLTSSVMKSLSEMIEEKAAPIQGDGLRYTRTGSMFAADLLGRARDVRVSDPTARQNLKAFVYQCFTWPFVISKFPPGAEAAQEAEDILGFVAASPHPSLGMYWRYPDGSSSFKSCKECIPLVKKMMEISRPKGLQGLLQGIFTSTPLTEKNASLLKSYANRGWSELTQGSSNVFEMVGQQMMINAYREGLDDHRESFGLSRLDPRLVSHHATRAMAQQNTGFLMNGAIMARHLPVLQNVMFGILLFLFVVVVPLSLMPGGARVLGTWAKYLVWCQSWPVFYTLLNCVGLMWLQQSLKTTLLGDGGVTIMTQNGLSEAAFNAYCIVQNLSYAVPFLSWAILTGSGHALVSLSERMTTANGASGAASLVDNTYTLDSTQLHNRSVANQQVAQQMLGASLSTGHTVDDGQFRVTSGGGNVAIQENMSSLGTGVSHSDLWQNSFSRAISDSEQATSSHQKAFSDAQSAALSNVSTLMDQWGQGKVSSKDFTESENIEIRNSFQKLQEHSSKFSDNNTANTNTKSQVGAFGSLGADLFGVKAGVDGRIESAALNEKGRSLAKSAGLTDQDISNLNKGISHAMSGRVSTSSDMARKASKDLRANWDSLQNASHQMSASYARTKALNQTASYLQNSSASLTRNMIDDVLEHTANLRFGGDKVQAAHYQKNHPQEFARDVRDFEQGFTNHLLDQVMRSGTSSPEQIRASYDSYASQVKSGVQDHRDQVHFAQANMGLSDIKDQINRNVQLNEKSFYDQKSSVEEGLMDHKSQTQEVHQDLDRRVNEDLNSSTVGRSFQEVKENIYDIGSKGKDIYEGLTRGRKK